MSAPKKRRTRQPSIRAEIRDIAARLQRIEEELSRAKIAAEASQRSRSKWSERAWDVAKSLLTFVLVASLVYGAQTLQCVPAPSRLFDRIEVKP